MKKRKPIFVFLAVIKALFLREIEMRMSIGKSGLFWTFFEPFLQIFIFISLHALISRASSFNITVFLSIGFISFNMFRSIMSTSTGAFNANRGLFIYKQVKPIDTIISRALIELFFSAIIIIIFLLIGFFLEYDNFWPKNPAMVLLGIIWLWFFAIGVGILVGVGNTFFVSVGKFISLISFGLLLFSAVFFPLAHLPPSTQNILLYNPLVHFMEMIHGYYINELNPDLVNYRYMILWTVAIWFIGLKLYIALEKRIISA